MCASASKVHLRSGRYNIGNTTHVNKHTNLRSPVVWLAAIVQPLLVLLSIAEYTQKVEEY